MYEYFITNEIKSFSNLTFYALYFIIYFVLLYLYGEFVVIIGLCGGSGSGKSTVAELFSEHGFLHINTDAIYHSLISAKSECRDMLVLEFGQEILEGEAINRQRLAKIVFADGSAHRLKALNEISHRYVLSEVRRIISELDFTEYRGAVVDAPLLFESGFDKECDAVVSVLADKDVRLERIISRDGITRERALERISKQLSDDVLIEKSDFVIINDNTQEELNLQIEKIINALDKGE